MALKKIFLSITLTCLMYITNAQNNADAILGTWLTNGNEPAKIEIVKLNGQFYGKIIWLKFPDDNNGAKKDINNPNKALKNQKIIGLKILKKFSFDKDKNWSGGQIYDPENGKTYSCIIKLKEPNTLEVRGYIGISLFGRTEIWKKTN
jgi:uncharacterized protein (DUF2147 family)